MDAKNNTDRDARSIVIRRTLSASPALVFEAWSHPMHLAQWWGPDGFSITTSAFDFRPGGVWRFVMHGPDGRDYQNRVTFDAIAPAERIEYHHGGGEDVEPVQFSSVVTFEAEGEKTVLTLRLEFPSAAERDRVVREFGAEEGGRQTLGRLDDYTSSWASNGGLEKSIEITRFIAAPRTLVFEAFTDAKHLAQWWGPKGFTNPVCEIDARPGGAILIHMQAAEGFSHPMTGTVHEVVPHDRFVFTAVARDDAGAALLQSHTTVTFRDEGRGTRLTVKADAKGLVPIARLMLAGMQEGWTQSLEKLAEFAEREG